MQQQCCFSILICSHGAFQIFFCSWLQAFSKTHPRPQKAKTLWSSTYCAGYCAFSTNNIIVHCLVLYCYQFNPEIISSSYPARNSFFWTKASYVHVSKFFLLQAIRFPCVKLSHHLCHFRRQNSFFRVGTFTTQNYFFQNSFTKIYGVILAI